MSLIDDLRNVALALAPHSVSAAEARWTAINRQAREAGCPCGRPATVVLFDSDVTGNVPVETWTCAEHEGAAQFSWITNEEGGKPEVVVTWDHPQPCPFGPSYGSSGPIGGPPNRFRCPHRTHENEETPVTANSRSAFPDQVRCIRDCGALVTYPWPSAETARRTAARAGLDAYIPDRDVAKDDEEFRRELVDVRGWRPEGGGWVCPQDHARVGVWRLGNRNPRNLYLDDIHVGMLVEPELAARIVDTMNAAANLPESNAAGLAGTTRPSGHPSGSEALSAASPDAHTAQVQRARETGSGHATITA